MHRSRVGRIGTLSGYRPPLPPPPLLVRIAYPAFELSCDRRCSVAQISRPIGRPFDRQFPDLDEEMRTAIDAQATRDPDPGAAAAGEYGRRRRKCRLLAEERHGEGGSMSTWSQTRPVCPPWRSSFLAAIATDRKGSSPRA